MRYVLPACAAGALLSLLLLPSAPLHDQWAWIVWGRELVHFDLDASAGPAWKPLPVLINAVLSPFGSAAPDLWLAVARFGGLLALVMGFRLAARFAGWPAGVVAVIALLSAWLRNVSLGISEGLLVAFLLWAVERHLDGKRSHALLLGFAAGLIRPEVWPFLGLYALFLWVREPKLRVLAVVVLVLTPILWFAPDALLAGEPLRSTEEAEASTTSVGGLDVVKTAYDLVPLPVHLAALAAVLLAWRRKEWAPVVLAAGAAGYVVIEIGLTVFGGFEGVARFLYPVLAIESVLGGVGVAWLALGAAAWLALRVRDGKLAAKAPRIAAAAIVVAAVPIGAWRISRLVDQLEPTTARHGFYEDLGDLVSRTGGWKAAEACGGRAFASQAQAPAVAWRLDVHIPQITSRARPPGIVYRVNPRIGRRIRSDVLPVQRVSTRKGDFRRIAKAGPWEALTDCKGARRVTSSSSR
jgi:hypothetical protein